MNYEKNIDFPRYSISNGNRFIRDAIRSCYISWYNYAVIVLKEKGNPWQNAPQ